MGIDANMLIRGVKSEIVTDEWLKDLSWRLCRAIGAEHFFIKDGIPSPEYTPVEKAWHKSFDSHPLYKQWLAAEDEERRRIHELIFLDTGKLPDERCLAIDKTMVRYRSNNSPLPGSQYQQDGDPVNAEDGECLLKVALHGRYYGPGYERGDILTYCAIAEWLEVNIPGCTVWYGGDSSGILAELFDDEARRKLRQHLYSNHGRDYFNHDFGSTRDNKRPMACSLCPANKYCGRQYGSGSRGKYSAFHCPGCGKSVESHDCGVTWQKAKDD